MSRERLLSECKRALGCLLDAVGCGVGTSSMWAAVGAKRVRAGWEWGVCRSVERTSSYKKRHISGPLLSGTWGRAGRVKITLPLLLRFAPLNWNNAHQRQAWKVRPGSVFGVPSRVFTPKPHQGPTTALPKMTLCRFRVGRLPAPCSPALARSVFEVRKPHGPHWRKARSRPPTRPLASPGMTECPSGHLISVCYG